MSNEDDNRRLLLAAALCLGVVGVWGVLFPPPESPPEPEAASREGGGGEAAREARRTRTSTPSSTVTATATVPTMAAAPDAPLPERIQKAEAMQFEGEVPDGDDPIPFEVYFTPYGGGIDRFILPKYRERRRSTGRKDPRPVELADGIEGRERAYAGFLQMAGIEFLEGTTFAVAELPRYEVVSRDGGSVRLRHRTTDDVVIEREWKVRPDSFLLEGAVTVRNESRRPHTHRLGLGTSLEAAPKEKDGGSWFSPSTWFGSLASSEDQLRALCYVDGSVKRESWSDLSEETETWDDKVRWVAVDRQYFVSSLITRDGEEGACRLSAEGDAFRSQLVLAETTLGPGEEQRHKFTAYLGVKRPDLMTLANADLEASIDYRALGMNLAPICTFLLWILRQFHRFTGSWGIAIIGLTFLVKLVLFPLNQRQGKSMRAMSALKPHMDEIREKFKDDQQRMNEELFKLYREHNVNPVGGCLPILIQMPIWIALYRSLWVSVDLYQQGFLWMSDLTLRDPYYILPVLLIAVMFLQQRMMPTTMDPAQQKMLQYLFPLIFGSALAAMPAGLCIYILANTVLTIIQQHFINRSIGGPAQPAPAEAKA